MNLLLPSLVYAQTRNELSNIIDIVVDYLNQFLFLMMAVAVVVFVWNVIKYFILPNEDRKDGNMYVLYSVIGFFVILSLWGIVNILSNTFQIGNTGSRPQTWDNFKNIFPN